MEIDLAGFTVHDTLEKPGSAHVSRGCFYALPQGDAMKYVRQCLFAAGLLATLTGCIPAVLLPLVDHHPTVYLYPVSGPASTPTLTQAITVKTTGLRDGSLSFALPSGETFEGAWVPLNWKEIHNDLAPVWEAIYGHEFYSTKILGSPRRSASTVTGSKGTLFHLEGYRTHGKQASFLGVAKDSNNNIYKISRP
jgi:hypothetical protein